MRLQRRWPDRCGRLCRVAEDAGQTVAHGSGADANGDGIIDDTDYSLWKAHFGATFGIGAGGGAGNGGRSIGSGADLVHTGDCQLCCVGPDL